MNGSIVGDKFLKVVPPETDRNKTAVFNYSRMSEKNLEAKVSITEDGRLKQYFYSKTVLSLNKKTLTETEIRVLEKRLDIAPIQKTLNEPELRKDFEELSHSMRCNCNFRNEPTNNCSVIPAFKSRWKPPKGHAGLEVLLSRVEKELSYDEMNDSTQRNLSGEERKALKNLADDGSIVIKGADKGFTVALWDRDDYLQEASRQLRDTNICKDVKFNENILTGLVERSNNIFNRLCSCKLVSDKELKYNSITSLLNFTSCAPSRLRALPPYPRAFAPYLLQMTLIPSLL